MALNHTPRTFNLFRGEPVTLTENEQIILERMKDADGTEYEMVFKGPADARQKSAPRDQLEPLYLKGLVSWLVGVAGHGEYGVEITPAGREVWSQLSKTAPTVSQYSELTEDEMIELASELASDLTEIRSEMVRRDKTEELVAVVRALKVRRDIAAPARRRVGEYLRQVAIQETRHVYVGRNNGPDGSSYGPRPMEDVIDNKREDDYASRATLRLSDLRRLVPPLVRDTEREFYDEQERRLTLLMQGEGAKIPEKQQALLPCIAKGHITKGRHSHSYDGTQGCCALVDGRTINALAKKSFIGSRMKSGHVHNDSVLMFKKPE